MVLITYSKRSESYKKLRALGTHDLPLKIHWGNTKTKLRGGLNITPQLAINKKEMLKTLDEHNIPTLEWTDDVEVAKENTPIYCRTRLCESKGKGIIRAENPEEVVRAPLYTKALDGYEEYRIHVMKGNVFYAQKKIARHEGANTIIKNIKDYYFSKRDITRLHPQLYEIPKNTMTALGLDFGAVDLLKKGNDIRVLEVNTAPGLDNSTAKAYYNSFSSLCNS